MGRRNQEQDFGPEPTFEEFEAARKVIIHVRRELAATAAGGDGGRGLTRGQRRDPLALADSPIMAEIIMRSSPVCNPALWEASQLASAEGVYVRSQHDSGTAESEGGGRA